MTMRAFQSQRAASQQQRTLLGVKPAHTARSRRHIAVPAAAATEVIDPRTGMYVQPDAVDSNIAGKSLVANGIEWRYRRTNVSEEAKVKSVAPLVMLHGLGSASYTYRNLLKLSEALNLDAIAPDWVGHGDSQAPPPSSFPYTKQAYMDALDAFLNELNLGQPINLVVQGFILPQYAMLYALKNPEKINRMVMLNTPVSLKTPLRPELAAYKNPLPFLRPGKKPFGADLFAATGNVNAFDGNAADNLIRPYLSGDSYNTALTQTMEALDWQGLLNEVDSGYRSWAIRTLLLYGTKDPFCTLKDAMDWLDSKRTTMRFEAVEKKLGHNPQEDDALAIFKPMVAFFNGENDNWTPTTELLRVGRLWKNTTGLVDVTPDDAF